MKELTKFPKGLEASPTEVRAYLWNEYSKIFKRIYGGFFSQSVNLKLFSERIDKEVKEWEEWTEKIRKENETI